MSTYLLIGAIVGCAGSSLCVIANVVFLAKLRPRLQSRDKWAGIFALRRRKEIEELGKLEDETALHWLCAYRALDLAGLLAAAVGMVFLAVYFWFE